MAAQGIAVLSMDCRGQLGESDAIGSRSHGPGWLTRGLESPEQHYYRTVYADAVRAAEVICSFSEVDTSRVAFTGGSQGGGLTLATAALSTRATYAWADIPFLCDFPRALDVASDEPYPELARTLRRRPDLDAQAFRTLSYIDVANLAPRVRCPVVVTVALWDTVCPPSTIFGTFSRLSSPDKQLLVYRFLGHALTYEMDEARLHWICDRFGL
jgi:cephalosporin-C deacetylase